MMILAPFEGSQWRRVPERFSNDNYTELDKLKFVFGDSFVHWSHIDCHLDPGYQCVATRRVYPDQELINILDEFILAFEYARNPPRTEEENNEGA